MQTGDYIDKPWGWERVLELNDRYCIKHLFIAQDQRLSKQYHQRKRETLILISGAIELAWTRPGMPEEVLSMADGEPYMIAPGTVHRMRGVGTEGGLILEVSTTEMDDVVRLEDDYGR